MSDHRPDDEALHDFVIDDLRGMFGVRDVDDTGFTLDHDGVATRVHISVSDLGRYVATIEESAYAAIGLEPRWRWGVSLTAVHVMEEATMAPAGTEVILDDSAIRRDPHPG
jgi:hypothetical protein